MRSGGKAPLYDTGVLRTIFLEFENAEWEKELEAFYNTDVEVPATLTVDGAVYRDVGVHFRGASSFMFVPEGSKRSLNVAIDFVHEDQRLLGYRTLNLLNVNSDPTFTRALLYAEVSRHYLPTPKANYLRVVINGESWGVYVNTQHTTPTSCANGSRRREAPGGRSLGARSDKVACAISARISRRTRRSTRSRRQTIPSPGLR